MAAGIWLGLRQEPRLPKARRRRRCDGDVRTEQRAVLRRRPGCVHALLRGHPVVGVVPGRGRYERMRLGGVIGLGRLDSVSGVEVGVEGEGVVGVALQGPDAVVMDLAQRVADRVGQHRMRTDFHEGGVVGAGGGDGMTESYRVAQIGRPMVGVENHCPACAVVVGGGDDRNGRAAGRQVSERGCAARPAPDQ